MVRAVASNWQEGWTDATGLDGWSSAAGAVKVRVAPHHIGRLCDGGREVIASVSNSIRVVLVTLLMLFGGAASQAHATDKLTFPVRNKTLTLTVYRPSAPVRGTIIMGSGDVGWVGLAVRMSEFLVQQGYVVIGFNVREYLSSFTSGSQHLRVEDARSDYRAMSQLLAHEGLLQHPVILSGVSEGAALAAAAAGIRQTVRGSMVSWRWACQPPPSWRGGGTT